jgi:hypothetical protein
MRIFLVECLLFLVNTTFQDILLFNIPNTLSIWSKLEEHYLQESRIELDFMKIYTQEEQLFAHFKATTGVE